MGITCAYDGCMNKNTYTATSSNGTVATRSTKNEYKYCVFSTRVYRDRVNGGLIAGSERIIAEWTSRMDLAQKLVNKNISSVNTDFDAYYIACEIVEAVKAGK
jgi:hypothetical protein